MITYLDIKKLIPHPNNPRKDLGDLTELSESIKENGVFQNLTVNDNGDDTYTVIIGHRRLAALKKIDAKTAPCIIVKMDGAKQVSTMLLENMQRTDLTPYEQAQGFQMCLDFGMDEALLKKHTGFSKATIKHRLNLLKLNQDKFRKGVEKGATLQDYIDLEKIEDEELKDKILDSIGTKDYRFTLNVAINQQENKKKMDELILKLKEYMTELDERSDEYEFVYSIYGSQATKALEIPSDINERKYAFTISEIAGAIFIYKEILESDKDDDEDIKPEPLSQTDLNVEKIHKKTVIAYQTRLEFAKNIYKMNPNGSNSNIEFRYAFALISNSLTTFYQGSGEIFKEVTGVDLESLNFKEDIIFDSLKNSHSLLFALIYANLETERDNITVNSWKYDSVNYGKFNDSNKREIDAIYDFLELYSYQASDEEKEIMFGKHELYLKEGE